MSSLVSILTNICRVVIYNDNFKLIRPFFLLLTICFLVLPAQGQYGGGNGRADDPYLIYTPADMNEIGANPNDWNKHFKLMADIDLGGFTGTSFNIIGTASPHKPFTGTFDGNGHKIVNFTYHSTGTNEIGLFSYVDVNPDAEIKNLGLIDPNVEAEGGTAVGALVGWLGVASITSCYVEGGKVSGGDMVGGLVGWDVSGPISNCYTTCQVSGNYFVGGLAGQVLTAIIYDSYSTGYVFGDNSVGGLAGLADAVNCYSTSSVFGTTAVGGLLGHGFVVRSYSAGSVSGGNVVGGLVGYEGAIDSYSLSSVSGDDCVGGLIGKNWTSIINCYSAGHVSGTTDVGGLVGRNLAAVTSCFWDIEASEQENSAGGTGETTTQMQMESTFSSVGWDFTTPIWTICEGTNYPRLVWQVPVEDFLCPDGVTMFDFAFLAAYWLESNCEELNDYCEGCDLDRSGTVDITDLRIFVDSWLVGVR